MVLWGEKSIVEDKYMNNLVEWVNVSNKEDGGVWRIAFFLIMHLRKREFEN